MLFFYKVIICVQLYYYCFILFYVYFSFILVRMWFFNLASGIIKKIVVDKNSLNLS